MRVDVLIAVPNMAVDLVMDALTEMIRGVLTKIGVAGLVAWNINAFAGVMAAFDFAPLKEFRC